MNGIAPIEKIQSTISDMFSQLASAAEDNLKASERLYDVLHMDSTPRCSRDSGTVGVGTPYAISVPDAVNDACRLINDATLRISKLTDAVVAEYEGRALLR